LKASFIFSSARLMLPFIWSVLPRQEKMNSVRLMAKMVSFRVRNHAEQSTPTNTKKVSVS